jgi:hypothetical protein
MDDIVKQAMAKWPNVPDCYGWLGLDARGNWYMRDESSQAIGFFGSGIKGAKGSLLQHEKLIDFIQRNYAQDSCGRWFFQNGPQRVYVELQATPWVWRVSPEGDLSSHTGQRVDYRACILDERGWLYLETSLGIGLVHTLDVVNAAPMIESNRWIVKDVFWADLPSQYGYVLSPQKSRL